MQVRRQVQTLAAFSLCWSYRGSHKENGIKLKMDLQKIRL